MKLRRQPRKQMKLRDAAEILQISKSSVRNEIYVHRTLRIANEGARRGPTSPIKLFQAEVEELARTWGIL